MSRGYRSAVFPGLCAVLSLAVVGCSRNEPPAPATTTVVSALNASPKTSDFVIEAQNSVRLQTGGMVVNGGDIGARGTTGPFLADSAAVDALTGVQVQTTHNIIAASVNLGTGAKVGDVQTSHLVSGTGATHGTVSALVALPALPVASAVSPGTANLTVATGVTVSASPAHFATISVGTGSTLKLAAGAYDMTTLTLSTGAKLQALGAVQIHVAGKVTTSSGAIIGPASGVTLTASGIRIEVSGQNGSTGTLTATPPAASFGTGNNVTALILVPNGTLAFGTGAIAKGAFMGRDVDLGGAGATITYQDGFSGGATCTAQSCDDSNPCTVDTCGTNGLCTHASAATGTSCSDGNACNGAETCDGAGTCRAGTPVVCAASDACHVAGTCAPATGVCSNPTAANGTTCNDGNLCTQTDTCQSGVCTGGSPKTCTASDQCHVAGTCAPATGVCSNPTAANGTSCNDGNLCTQMDTCQTGVCTGGNPKSCTASDQCHLTGTCAPATGVCSNPVAANGTSCNDGNLCTQTDTCQSGACTGGSPKSCTASDQCHVAGTCAPATGVCSNPTAANGTSCNDGNLCTQTDTCQSGACTGGSPKTCTASDQCHVAGSCAPATGVCSNPVAANGTTCNDGNACTHGDSCQAGACAGSPVACVAQDQCHVAGMCNPSSGACTNPTRSDGSACDDGNSCTSGDSCLAGSCAPGAMTCAALTVVQDAGIQTVPQLGVTLSTTHTGLTAPGDVLSFTSIVTNTGIFFQQFGFIDITNNGSTPFTVGSYQQTIEYFSPASQTWIPVGKVSFDSSGTEVDDPTLTRLESGGVFGATIAPGTTFTTLYIVRATFPADITSILFDPARASQVRSVAHIDTGSGTPGATSDFDLTGSFAGASGAVTGTSVLLSFIGGGLESDSNLSAPDTTIQPGASITFMGTCPAPALPPRDPSESDGDYFHRLDFGNAFGNFAARAFANAHGTPSDPGQVGASIDTVPWQYPVLTLGKSGPAQGNAGLTLPYTVQLQNTGKDVASGISIVDTVNGSDVGAQVAIPPSVASGTTGTATVNAATPLNQPPGPVTDIAVVTWKDRNGNLYGPLSTPGFTANILAGHSEGYLTLSGTSGGQQVLGSPQTLKATALDGLGKPAPGVAVHLAITGINAQSVDLVTGADGTASFSYDGPGLGQDHATLTATIHGPAIQSNTIGIEWVSEVGPPCTSRSTPLDVILVIDGSPSMLSDDEIGTAQAAADSLVDQLNFSQDQIGAVFFSGDAELDAPLTTDAALAKSEINTAISNFTHACDGFCAGGSNFAAAMGLALAEFQGPRHHPGASPLMIFVSDGGNTGIDPSPAIAQLQAAGIRTIAVGLGTNVNVSQMKQIATSTNDYFYAPSAAELGWVYGNVAGDSCRTSAPLVSAGGNQGMYGVRLPDSLTLQGEAHGAGPRGDLNLTSTWTELSGPAPVAFADASSPVTSVLFTEPGTYVLQLEVTDGFVTTADRATITVDPAPSLTGANLMVSLSAAGPLTVGTPETLTAILTDTLAHPIANFLVQVTVTGANPTSGTFTTNAAGAATFTYRGATAGTDLLQAVAIGGTAQLAGPPLSVTWKPANTITGIASQGWIGSPVQRALVTGQVPITVAAGVTVASGTVSYGPAKSPTDIHTLTTTAQGSSGATLATLDTTTLPNGTYIIDLTGTDNQGHQQESEVLVAVSGEYKPGRKVVDVTEFTVPLSGVPITVGRRYDSLNKDIVGDFGNGWSLTVGHPDLQVDQANDVTITMPNGRRSTFIFELLPVAAGPVVLGFLAKPLYVGEPGVFGTLTSDGCNLLAFDPNSDSPNPICFASLFDPVALNYAPTTYQYTDPYGTVHTMGADGTLKTIQDRNQNILTFTPAGITSSAGNKVVTFTRDGQGRITSILEPKQVGNFQFEYDYNYDATGNLISAFAPTPGGELPARYTYDDAHRLLKSIDYNGNPARTSTYDGSGRLASDTDAMGNATTYAYDVSGRTTTTTYPDTGVMTQTFDARGSVLSQTDQLGRTTTHVYDANENETKRTNALGEATRYTYDTNGNQTSSTNALGEATTTTYNAFSEPLTTTNPIGNTTTIAYDDHGLPTGFTDSMGALATFTSSEHGQPTSVTDAVGNPVYLNYDDSGDFTSRTDRLGRVTSYTYDGIGLKQTMRDPRHGVTQYAYDFGNDLVTTILPLGFGPSEHLDANRNVHQVGVFNNTVFRDTDYDHDADNHLILTTNDDDGSTIHQTVDFRGNVLSVTDEAGHTTSHAYDLSGELLRTTNPDGTFTTQSYDALGRLSSKTDERGNTTVYGYEPGCSCTDRLTSVTDPLDRATITTYDGMSRKTSVTDPAGHQTFYAYDVRGHLIETDYADATSTHDTYDILGRRIASVDQSGATTHYGYDAEGQLTSVTDPLGNLTRYAYDPNGNLTSVTDANNHTTTYGYDANNRKISRTLPLGMTETFAFDDNDNLVGHTDFRGKTTTYTFDARRPGRLIHKTPDPSLGEPIVSFALNVTNTRASMADASGATSYTYDTRDRLLTKATPEGTLRYTYDASGNVASISSSNANGTSVGYAWDSADQLVSVTDDRLGGITTAAYTATGRPSTLAQSNGVGATYAYDSLDRVTSLAWQKSPAAAFTSWAYSYSARGQRVTSTDVTGREATYGYDAAQRLTSETIIGDPRGTSGNGALTYSIDPVGNRLSRASTLGALDAQTFECDANDELTSDGYDLNGNTTSSGGHTFAYDFENRLVSRDGGAITIVYDGEGNRVAKTAGGVTTRYLVDDLNPTGFLQVLDEVSGGAVQVRYTFGTMPVSQTRGASTTPASSFYGYDAQRNVAFLTDAMGNLTDTYDYDAWGNIVEQTGTTPNTRLYDGEERDPDLGLVNLRARQYRPSTGRFLTIDSLDKVASTINSPDVVSAVAARIRSPYIRARAELSIDRLGPDVSLSKSLVRHRYGYGNGDPLTFIDPTGLDDALTYGLLAVAAESFAVVLQKALVPATATAVIVLAASIDTINDASEPILGDLAKDFGAHPNYEKCIADVRAEVKAAIEAVLNTIDLETDGAAWDREVREIYKDARKKLQACLGPGN